MRRCLGVVVGLLLFCTFGPVQVSALPDSAGQTTRISVRTGGGQITAEGPAAAGQPAVSENGFVVAFVSDATNLVVDDTNGVADVFVSQSGVIKRVSLGADFAQANGASSAPALSGDGRFVTFTSAADNLVPGDTNAALDVFVYDRQLSTVTLVSVAGDGSQGNGNSRAPSIDRTGSVVAFTSEATNLVVGDANGHSDVFVRRIGVDPATTTLVSAAAGGSGSGDGVSDDPSLSRDGSTVAFASDAANLVAGDGNGHKDVFRRSLADGSATELVSLRNGGTTVAGNGDSFSPSVSVDGALVAFASRATNLLGSSDDNDVADIFLRTPQSKSTALISQSCGSDAADDASSDPQLSSDTGSGGAGVSFVSDASNLLQGCSGAPAPDNNNLPDVYFRPLGPAPVVNERVSRDPAGAQFGRPSLESAVSGDGRLVAFTVDGIEATAGGPGAGAEVFGRDRSTTPGATTGLSTPADGPALGPAVTEAPAISDDGNIVAYASAASDLVTDDSNSMTDVFVSDRARKETTRVSRGLSGAQSNGSSAADSAPALSADGQVVAFSSAATNLVAGDNNGVDDVFVFDRARQETTRVNLGAGGVEATGRDSFDPALSSDGRFVAFASDAANLAADDTNNATDVFVHDRQARTTVRVSLGAGGAQAIDGESYAPAVSADGTVVAFVSRAVNLAPDATDGIDDTGDTPESPGVFVRDLKAGTTTWIGAAGGPEGPAAAPRVSLSANGRFVAYAGGTDVFVFDRQVGGAERISVGPGGAPGDRTSSAPALSADGRFVAFQSDATNLVPADTNQRTDVFVRDRRLGTTTRVSLGPVSLQGDRPSTAPRISGDGRFVAFQSAAANLVPADTNSAPDIFVHDRTPVRGYWLVAADGGIFAYGSAVFAGSTGGMKLVKPIVAMAASPTGQGYWLVASDGGVFAFGDAGFFGSTGAIRLAKPIVGLAPTSSGKGYWLVASDGGIFAFGDAGFFGSTGAMKLAQPIVGVAPTPTGKGYWLVASDGGIFAFGDAPFLGSTGAIRLARPVLGMASTPTGAGYWMVGSDGGVFSFGDAGFFGSTGATKLNKPIVGLAPSPSGGGYWLVASDGGIFAFGDAVFFGSTGATKLAQPVVGMAAIP